MPRRLRVPLVGEIHPVRRGSHRWLERQARAVLNLVRQLAADRVRDIDFTSLQGHQTGCLIRYDLKDDAFHGWLLPPKAIERFHHKLDAGREGNEFVGPGTDRRLLEVFLANRFDVSLRHDPARPGGIAVVSQEIRPWLRKVEPDGARGGNFYRRHPLFHQCVAGAVVAVEGEFYVLGRYRLSVMEFGSLAEHEIEGAPIGGYRPGFRQSGGQVSRRHGFDHGVMQRIQHHVGCDDPERFRRVEPGRRKGDVDADYQRAGGGSGCRGGRAPSQDQQRQGENDPPARAA